jgi:hypothetical protein
MSMSKKVDGPRWPVSFVQDLGDSRKVAAHDVAAPSWDPPRIAFYRVGKLRRGRRGSEK